jgi:hypothetical protein
MLGVGRAVAMKLEGFKPVQFQLEFASTSFSDNPGLHDTFFDSL